MKAWLSIYQSIYQKHRAAVLLLFATWGIYLVVLFARILQVKPDGIYVGSDHMWSDWPLHIGMASIFAYKSPQYWFAYHPMYAEGKFTYGFLTNFISGMLMRAGLPVSLAFTIPSMICALLLLLGMYTLFYLLFQSKKQSLIALSTFLLSSGLGFIHFIKDFVSHPSIALILYPPQNYSRFDSYTWVSGNVIGGFLVPQRAFLLGFTISIWALAGLVYVLLERGNSRKQDKILLIISGVLVGILPIAHIHSFIAIFVITLPLCYVASLLRREWLDLAYYAVPAGIISIALYLLFISGGIENPDFIRWYPGWNSKGGFLGWVVMWFKLWGLTLPMAILGFVLLRKTSLIIQTFFAGFFVLFALSNLILFQPITWDNSKLFIWAYFGFSGLATVSLSWLWRKAGKTISRFDVVFLAVLMTFTGFLEAIRLQNIDRNQLQLTGQDDINLGLEIRKKTDPLAVFLTEPTNNSFVMVWGARSILMGFTAWVGNFGFLYQQREKDLRVMYEGSAQTEQLLDQYKISYVVIGPGELQNLQANEAYYRQTYPVAFQNRTYRIYDVRSIWNLKRIP
jgi:hypothetical protein